MDIDLSANICNYTRLLAQSTYPVTVTKLRTWKSREECNKHQEKEKKTTASAIQDAISENWRTKVPSLIIRTVLVSSLLLEARTTKRLRHHGFG